MKKRYIFGFCTIMTILLLFSACSDRSGKLLEKESLFSLEYGRMEDQMDIDQAAENYTPKKNRIIMQNGIFHVSNGNSCKIMEFNSYGEILNLYYSREKNPEPVILSEESDDGATSTRNVYAYAFTDIGEIAVDSRKQLYIDDRIAENRIERDEDLGVPLDRIILQFDQAGNYIDYLGQEGSGGTPFSYIEKIKITLRDELVVYTRNTGGWRIFWFSNEGRPLYIVDVNSDALPFADEEERPFSFAVLETVSADMTNRLLYLKIDYYVDHSRDIDSEETGIAFNNSLIWTLDVAEGSYGEYTEIPINIKEEEKPQVYNEEQTRLLYEFIGTSGDGVFYLLSLYDRNSYNLVLLNREGRVIQNAVIDLGAERLMIRNFHVSRDGILTALLGWEESMEVAWWRTDKSLKRDE